MTTSQKHSRIYLSTYQPLIAAVLAVGGFFSLVSIVLADTAAGTAIRNTATATYSNPATGETSNVESNPVIVTVAEVAGITVDGTGFTEASTADGDGQVDPSEVWYYNYTITNVGNDPTHFRLPSNATVTGPGNIGGSFQYFDPVAGVWRDYTTAITSDTTQFPNFTNGFAAGESLQIRVPVLVDNNAAANSTLAVEFGDTPSNNGQNLADPSPDATFDVYTVDLTAAPDADPANPPANGTREASDIQTLTISQTVANNPLALVTLAKTLSNYDDAGTSTSLDDDTLTYSLEFTVEDTDQTGNGIQPTALVGTTITVEGVSGDYILVSDAIPANTKINNAPASIPSGWQFVYTTTAVTTDANAVDWQTASAGAALPTGVTRVGFIRQTSIAPGTTVSGFSITVEIESSAASVNINNVAQVFGETLGVPDQVILDESGDQNPSNYNDDGSHPYDTNSDGIPEGATATNIDDGFVDVPDATGGEYGADPTGTNTGSGTGGEANIFTANTTGGTNSILNGPQGTPGASGPTGINDDFTNQAATTAAGTDYNGTLTAETPIQFINTIENNGTAANTYTLLPNAASTPNDIPDGTKVEITDGLETAEYTWNGTTWTRTTGSVDVTIQLAASSTADYEVTIKLPVGTPISTAPTFNDTDGDGIFDVGETFNAVGGATVNGYGIPIVSFIEDGTTGFQGTEVSNTTIDRAYLGYVRLVKESRLLTGTGPVVSNVNQVFSPTDKTAAPGNIIEYRITYENISEPQLGSGNVLLEANNLVLTEDGTDTALGNSWALDNDANGFMDTINVSGSAVDSNGGSIQFFSGATVVTTTDSSVTQYVDTVPGLLLPQDSGNFTFRREVE